MQWIRNMVKTKINKKSAIVIPQGVPLILFLYLASSLFYLWKPTLPKPLFLPRKSENLFPMPILSSFLCCLSLCHSLTLVSCPALSLSQNPLFFFFFFSTFLSGFLPATTKGEDHPELTWYQHWRRLWERNKDVNTLKKLIVGHG